MNQDQQAFSDLFMDRLEANATAYGVNSAAFTTGTIFGLQEQLLKSVGAGTLSTVGRAVYGVGSSIVIGGGSEGAIAGSIGGMAVGVLVTVGAVALLGGSTPVLIGAAIAGGLSSTAGGVFFQSLYEAYGDYSSSRGSTPAIDAMFPSDFDGSNLPGTVLEPIIVNGSSPISHMYGLLNQLQSVVDDWNSTFQGPVLTLSINELLNNSEAYWFQKLVDIPGGNVPTRDKGLELIERLIAAAEDIKQHFDENRDEIAELDPAFEQVLDSLINGTQMLQVAGSETFTPLVLDLDGNGIGTLSIRDNDANFDFLDGVDVGHGWIGPTDGFLALDKNDNGIIDDASELFGSPQSDGFSILAQFDENNDGVIDRNDAIFSSLNVWRDGNSDGQSSDDELFSLADFQIASINITPHLQTVYSNGNWIPLTSSFTLEDGSHREIADVYFTRATYDTTRESTDTRDSYVIRSSFSGSVVEGSEKDQIFVGGVGRDTFVFKENSGNDLIKNFVVAGDNHDVIDLTGLPIQSFIDLRDLISQEGDDAIIDLSNGSSVTLLGVIASNLTVDNFVFLG